MLMLMLMPVLLWMSRRKLKLWAEPFYLTVSSYEVVWKDWKVVLPVQEVVQRWVQVLLVHPEMQGRVLWPVEGQVPRPLAIIKLQR